MGVASSGMIDDEIVEALAANLHRDDNQDNRHSRRWSVDKPCRVELEQQSFLGRLRDISGGGAFVESSVLPPDAADVYLTFPVGPHGDVLRLEAVVRHRGRFLSGDRNFLGFGAEFQSPSTAYRARLLRLIQTSGNLDPDRKYVLDDR